MINCATSASVGMLYWCGALVGSVTLNDFSVYKDMAEVTSVYTFFTVLADNLTESLLIQFCRSALVTVSIITGPIVVRCVLAICSYVLIVVGDSTDSFAWMYFCTASETVRFARE